MGDIQSQAQETFETPDGETLVREDYLPPSYAGSAQLVECDNCGDIWIGVSDVMEQTTVDPYHQYCQTCETWSDYSPAGE